ncbi:MAG: hypothetical protein ACRDJI_09265 [Actinomycetota bacterium]
MRALFPLILGLGLIVIALDQPSDKDLEPAEQSGGLVGGLIVAGACGWVGVRLLRPAVVRRAAIKLRPGPEGTGELVVDHHGLLKKPLVVPRALVRCAAIDHRPARWRWFRDHKRFNLAGADEGSPSWLWSRTGDCPLPLLSHVGDVPNLAVLFDSPVPLRSVRRWMKPFALKGPVHILRRGQQARGFVARLQDPERALQALQTWTFVRPLTLDDVSELEPGPDERRKARGKRIRTNIALLVIAAVYTIPPMFVEPD